MAVSNGVPGGVSDENLAKAITASANWVGEYGRFGLSGQWNKRTTTELFFGGVNGGFRVWNFIVLGEFDVQKAKSRTGARTINLLAGYGEFNWMVIDGLYIKAIYDFLDPDTSVSGDLQHRLGLGFDLYPLPYSQISILYRVNVAPGAAGDDQILAKVHFFF